MKQIIFSGVAILVFGIFGFALFAQKKEILLSEAFAKMNYQIKSQNAESPTKWEKEQFQMLTKETYRVKRKTPLKGNQQKLFPRFEVTKEIYADENSAQARAARIREKPPNLPIEKEEYWMVTGFRRGKIVYFISTDATIFYAELGVFADKLRKSLTAKSVNNNNRR